MHEYSLMESIIQSILERLAEEDRNRSVSEVVLKIGVLDVHSEVAARQAFQVLIQGTPLERARLDLVVLPATLECLSCGHIEPFLVDHHHSHDPLPVAECPRCRQLARLTGGHGVEAIDLVLADHDGT